MTIVVRKNEARRVYQSKAVMGGNCEDGNGGQGGSILILLTHPAFLIYPPIVWPPPKTRLEHSQKHTFGGFIFSVFLFSVPLPLLCPIASHLTLNSVNLLDQALRPCTRVASICKNQNTSSVKHMDESHLDILFLSFVLMRETSHPVLKPPKHTSSVKRAADPSGA